MHLPNQTTCQLRRAVLRAPSHHTQHEINTQGTPSSENHTILGYGYFRLPPLFSVKTREQQPLRACPSVAVSVDLDGAVDLADEPAPQTDWIQWSTGKACFKQMPARVTALIASNWYCNKREDAPVIHSHRWVSQAFITTFTRGERETIVSTYSMYHDRLRPCTPRMSTYKTTAGSAHGRRC